MGACMTPDEKADILRRLLVMTQALRQVSEAAEAHAAFAHEAGAEGLAIATYMLGESIKVFSKELAKFTTKYIEES